MNTYNFLANSNLISSIVRPNNLTTDYSYENNRDLIVAVVNKYNVSNTISNYSYGNDAIGQITSKSRTGTAFTTTDTITLGYNDRSEVVSAVSSNIVAYNYGFTFDNIGNRNSYTVAGTNTTYTTNNLNQYTAITQGATVSPTYNDDGCMLTDGAGWNNTWDCENRLIETYNDTVGKKLEFKYDYMGRRVEKKVYSGSIGNWTLNKHLKFVYNNYEQIEELDGANSDAILKKRIWANSKIIADIHGTTAYYALSDANKNITEYLDISGNVQAHYEYSPFGKVTKKTGTKQNDFNFRFSSEYLDSEIELLYYNYRYYSPLLGRWLSRDPIGEKGGYNLYGMIGNNSVSIWDNLGLDYAAAGGFGAGGFGDGGFGAGSFGAGSFGAGSFGAGGFGNIGSSSSSSSSSAGGPSGYDSGIDYGSGGIGSNNTTSACGMSCCGNIPHNPTITGCCAKKKPFSLRTQCCRDGKVFENKTKSIGIRTCAGRINTSAPFSADHEWIEVDSRAYGFATGGSITGSVGAVRDDSTYMKRTESFWDRNCHDIKLNPCEYDIDSLKNCITSELGSKYWYIAGARDCAWWVNEVMSLCVKANKR